MNLSELQSQVKLALSETAKKREERLNKISAKAALRNDGLAPTLDKDGRFHAPCDGYYYDDGERDGEYLGGEYLPIPEDEDSEGRSGTNFTIKITNCSQERFEEIYRIYRASCGQSYFVEDVKCCYVYLSPLRCAEADRLVTAYLQEPILALTEKRKEALEAKKAKQAEAKLKASPAPVTDDRIEITGEVVAKKFDEGWGVLKILVITPEGWTTWGTCPSSLEGELGDKISFMAKVKPARNDEKHCFFSRPTKAKAA
mgnify:CR=1 FL=1|tara:strand:+ start:320 stop:1090 length:771 start_codon:yes stop_codon:yes gene_type:complete